jgi:hypothetical protein
VSLRRLWATIETPPEFFQQFQLLLLFCRLGNDDEQLVTSWNSVSKWTYRVQYKTSLNDANWTDLSGDVLATNVIAGKMDTAT